MAAGAFAMAAGEYVSVRSQRELFEYQIGLERDELRQYPEAEAQELALIYAAKGLPPKEATPREAARRRSRARARHARARRAGAQSRGAGLAVGRGDLVPVVRGGRAAPLAPFMVGPRACAAVAIGVTAAGLFAVGAALSLFTGRNALTPGCACCCSAASPERSPSRSAARSASRECDSRAGSTPVPRRRQRGRARPRRLPRGTGSTHRRRIGGQAGGATSEPGHHERLPGRRRARSALSPRADGGRAAEVARSARFGDESKTRPQWAARPCGLVVAIGRTGARPTVFRRSSAITQPSCTRS